MTRLRSFAPETQPATPSVSTPARRCILTATMALAVTLSASLALAQTLTFPPPPMRPVPATAPVLISPATPPAATLPDSTPPWGAVLISPATPPGATSTAPLSGTATFTPSLPVPATLPTSAFVGAITADRVYVRSGPGVNYYELGLLAKGDTVQVVESKNGWYKIAPPTGTFCYIVKELVQLAPDGASGTVKGDYVNVHAASTLHPASDYAILTVVRKGAGLTILGSHDKYYKISPPEKAYVYISPQFVVAAPAGTLYAAPGLRVDGSTTPATRPAEGVENIVIQPPANATTEPAATQGAGVATTEPAHIGVAALPPTTTYSADAADRYNALNAKLQTEFQKPLLDRQLGPALEDFQALLKMPDVSPTIRQNTQARIAIIQKTIALQNLAKSTSTEDQTLAAQREALQKQYGPIEEQMKEWDRTGPLLAEGRLQTSSVLRSRYVLVNPATGRVAAYIDPASEIDLAKVLGSYIGVRGTVESAEGVAVRTIKVRSATLLPDPQRPATTNP